MKMESAQAFKTESLKALSHALRHRETWPPGFTTWDYHDCDTCAIGLAHKLGMIEEASGRAMMNAFGLSVGEASRLFCEGFGRLAAASPEQITPEQIANRIDALLDARSRTA